MQTDKKMNDAQRKAVTHDMGPMLVLAGPGSGKTMVVTKRVRYLIENRRVRPDRILVITFTRAAALEMRKRYLDETGRTDSPVTFGTFHSVYFHIIRHICPKLAVQVLTQERKLGLIQEILRQSQEQDSRQGQKKAGETDTDEEEQGKELALSIAKELGRIKNSGLSLDDYLKDHPVSFLEKETFWQVCSAYEASLALTGEIDFDDMLIKCRELLLERQDALKKWQDQYQYILIDEFQDSATRFRLR